MSTLAARALRNTKRAVVGGKVGTLPLVFDSLALASYASKEPLGVTTQAPFFFPGDGGCMSSPS